MKKILICLVAAIVFSNCELKVRESKARGSYRYEFHTEIIDGMKYGIWQVSDATDQTGYATTVVNLTKEALEVELLKKQLAEK